MFLPEECGKRQRTAAKPVILLRCRNDGQEIGRSRAEVDLQKDDADYVVFVFHQQMDSQLVSKYRIDLAR